MKTTLATTAVSAAELWLLASLAPADIVGFEAESGSTPAAKDAYRVQDDPDALGGQYIDSDHRDLRDPIGDLAVFREYSLTLPAGTYDFWVRIYCPTFFTYIEGEGETTTFVVRAGPAAVPDPAAVNRIYFQVRGP